MRSRKSKSRENEPRQQRTRGTENNTLPIIGSARTGLVGKDDAIMKNLPKSYAGKTIDDALDYLLQPKALQDDDIPIARSIEKEMNADGFVVVVNGKNAKLGDKLADYLVREEHQLPGGQVKAYQALEMEISSIQEGGFYRFY